MSTRLSVLICHLPHRAAMLAGLRSILDPQCDGQPVEVLVNPGDGTTGRKRNELLSQARGDYIAFIDDDDDVSGDYISKILSATVSSPDCVGIEGIITRGGNARRNPKRFVHSLKCDAWCERDSVYYRYPNHLNPVRRELAVQVGFPDQTVSEDRAYSDALRPLLKTEVFVDGPIYYYLADRAD